MTEGLRREQPRRRIVRNSVELRMEYRSIRLDDAEDTEYHLSYPGYLLTSYHGDSVVKQVWIPIGPEPTEPDDERIMRRLHDALKASPDNSAMDRANGFDDELDLP